MSVVSNDMAQALEASARVLDGSDYNLIEKIKAKQLFNKLTPVRERAAGVREWLAECNKEDTVARAGRHNFFTGGQGIDQWSPTMVALRLAQYMGDEVVAEGSALSALTADVSDLQVLEQMAEYFEETKEVTRDQAHHTRVSHTANLVWEVSEAVRHLAAFGRMAQKVRKQVHSALAKAADIAPKVGVQLGYAMPSTHADVDKRMIDAGRFEPMTASGMKVTVTEPCAFCKLYPNKGDYVMQVLDFSYIPQCRCKHLWHETCVKDMLLAAYANGKARTHCDVCYVDIATDNMMRVRVENVERPEIAVSDDAVEAAEAMQDLSEGEPAADADSQQPSPLPPVESAVDEDKRGAEATPALVNSDHAEQEPAKAGKRAPDDVPRVKRVYKRRRFGDDDLDTDDDYTSESESTDESSDTFMDDGAVEDNGDEFKPRRRTRRRSASATRGRRRRRRAALIAK